MAEAAFYIAIALVIIAGMLTSHQQTMRCIDQGYADCKAMEEASEPQ